MLKKTRLCTGLMVAFGGLAMVPAVAQQTLERVEVTGSAIKRIDAETAVPVTVLKMDDLRKQGITTVEQALAHITGSQSQFGTSQSIGLGTGGAAFADVRGLGQNKTLILLNGRRLANNVIDGSTPDLNMIPFTAIARIEVLRDGASALYGTDAIGGVINFITRSELQGGAISGSYSQPEHPGGQAFNANVTGGWGDLATQGFNVLAALDYQTQAAIQAKDRQFGSTGFIPDKGIFRSSGNAAPANYNQGGASANPAGPACNSNPFIFHQSGFSCREDFTKFIYLIPDSERMSAFVRGTFKLNPDHQVNAEYFVTQDTVKTQIAPVPFAGLPVNNGTPFFPGNGITPPPTNFAIDPTKPISVSWRDTPNGNRAEQDTNVQQRFLLGLQGTLANWDYNTAITLNKNTNDHEITGGYADGGIIRAGLANGTINPFGAQTAAGTAFLNSALVTGKLFGGDSEDNSIDARASRELGDWLKAGRPAAIAVGAEYRHQKIHFAASNPVAAALVDSTGVDPSTNQEGSRNITGVYTELNVPILKGLDVTGAVRYDHYSDFGSTTNPKFSFRYQPVETVLFRGSVSTGFRAPSLFELNNPITYTNTANSFNDPVLCPGGVAAPGHPDSSVCNTQFIVQNGGNKSLSPEKAKNANLGIVFEPVRGASVGFDYWWVRLKNQISVLPDTLIFADPAKNAALFHRNPAGMLSINGADCPGVNCGYITDTSQNLGNVNTDGFDLTASYHMPAGETGTFDFSFAGTYVRKYEYQQEQNGVYLQNAGVYSGTGPIIRWQHAIAASWMKGPWSAGLVNRFKDGYTDQNDPNQVSDPSFFGNVGSYIVWDIWGGWQPMKQLSLTLGVRNLFDRAPPFSNQARTFQTGYDPRFTDPTGRAYYAKGTYSF